MLSCCGEFNDALATYILQNREAVLERNREIVFRNLRIAQEWIDNEPRVTWQAPKGVSVAYIQWDIPTDDEEFCIKLLKEEGVLLVPGQPLRAPRRRASWATARPNRCCARASRASAAPCASSTNRFCARRGWSDRCGQCAMVAISLPPKRLP